MKTASLARLTIPAVLALGAGLTGPSAFPALAAEGCATPTLSATIDVAASDPLGPVILLTADELALPAQGRFDWGDGQYGVARLDDGDGALGVLTDIHPVYAKPGTYTVEMAVTDVCGATTILDIPLTVPLLVPSGAAIACPTPVDASGFCVVPLGSVSTFAVVGGDPEASWAWNVPAAEGPAGHAGHHFLASDPRPVALQATAATPEGWLVTPVLKVIAVAPPRPQITTFSDPLRATAGEPIHVAFAIPDGSAGGVASILVDDVRVADGTAASLRLQPGSHTITYVVTETDGGALQRQAVVLVGAPPPPIWPVAAAALTLLIVGAALRVKSGRRRSPESSPLSIPAPSALDSAPRGSNP